MLDIFAEYFDMFCCMLTNSQGKLKYKQLVIDLILTIKLLISGLVFFFSFSLSEC